MQFVIVVSVIFFTSLYFQIYHWYLCFLAGVLFSHASKFDGISKIKQDANVSCVAMKCWYLETGELYS
jgi:hypothetical protein